MLIKQLQTLHLPLIFNFNTSHVNVNQLYRLFLLQTLYHFNTSHVNVNPSLNSPRSNLLSISIHLMLMLIRTELFFCLFLGCISIHLMLMLIQIICFQALFEKVISIHLMLMLIIINLPIGAILSPISIHLMLMLIDYETKTARERVSFQYISC